MKKLFGLMLIALISTHSVYAQTPSNGDVKEYKSEEEVKEIKKKHKKKHNSNKPFKTDGKISTSGCEISPGKTIGENEQGYDECVRQIGMKKKHKK